MPSSRALVPVSTVLVVALAGAGCGHKSVLETPEPMPAPTTTVQPSTVSTTPAPSDAAPTPYRTDGADEASRTALEERIYFGFDRADLSADARATLGAKVAILRAAPAVTLRIEGHADERGSDEYNLALSNRRAAEAKRFLVQQGVEGGRLEAVGFGEEQPLDAGHDERAWARNRRDEFRVTGGAR